MGLGKVAGGGSGAGGHPGQAGGRAGGRELGEGNFNLILTPISLLF